MNINVTKDDPAYFALLGFADRLQDAINYYNDAKDSRDVGLALFILGLIVTILGIIFAPPSGGVGAYFAILGILIAIIGAGIALFMSLGTMRDAISDINEVIYGSPELPSGYNLEDYIDKLKDECAICDTCNVQDNRTD